MPNSLWDLTALLNAADPRASAVERHLWLIRWLEWLRAPAPLSNAAGAPAAGTAAAQASAPAPANVAPAPLPAGTPWPVRRLRHMLGVLERHPEHREHVGMLLRQTIGDLDSIGLLADYGFAPRPAFFSELLARLQLAVLPGTPQTSDLGELFQLVFSDPHDANWLECIDNDTFARVLALARTGDQPVPWRAAMIESIQLLASQCRATGMSPGLRQRMDAARLAQRPFHELVASAETLRNRFLANPDPQGWLPQVSYLRAVLEACRQAAYSVRQHLDEHGISINLVFQIDQLRERTERIELLLDSLIAPEPVPQWRHLLVSLARTSAARRGLRPLFRRHYALLARKVTERSAEEGEHYITRDWPGYHHMLRAAAGGGAVIGLTTLIKFGITALALSAFWSGFWAGVNYAVSFVVVYLLNWTVATKQPAMTAPSMAARLDGIATHDEAVESFVDEVAHLARSQTAGIIGNLALVAPVVLLAQALAWSISGAPLVGEQSARHVLHAQNLFGPSLLFAAFTGVLLFASSLIAGWAENWFVYHRLDSAIAWNPRFIATLGAARARRWAHWCRSHVSGLAANISLGLLLGIVPVVGAFFGIDLEVRHVTLSMGQLAAAAGALGIGILHQGAFWACLACIALIGVLNVGVSFWLAFRVAMASRGLHLKERERIQRAIVQRLLRRPLSFLLPPRSAANAH